MRDHHNLDAWKVAREVTELVISASAHHWKPWASALFSQLQRSSLSVQLNIAEGSTFGRSRNYTRFLGIAYGSAVETGEILEMMVRTNVLPREMGEELQRLSKRSQQLLVGLLKHHRPFTT
jgi:four helix bundle protein